MSKRRRGQPRAANVSLGEALVMTVVGVVATVSGIFDFKEGSSTWGAVAIVAGLGVLTMTLPVIVRYVRRPSIAPDDHER